MLVVSYTAVSPLPTLPSAVCFLWHFPAGHPGWALPTTLPCGARTFLDADGISAAITRSARPPRLQGTAGVEPRICLRGLVCGAEVRP